MTTMKVVRQFVGGQPDQQLTLVASEKRHYIISTVFDDLRNETMIFAADEKGRVIRFIGLYSCVPAAHMATVEALLCGTIPEAHLEAHLE